MKPGDRIKWPPTGSRLAAVWPIREAVVLSVENDAIYVDENGYRFYARKDGWEIVDGHRTD